MEKAKLKIQKISKFKILDLNIPVKMIRVSGRSIAVDVKSDINRVIKFLKKIMKDLLEQQKLIEKVNFFLKIKNLMMKKLQD